MKDVIDVLELQGQRENPPRKLIDYKHFDGSYVGVIFIFECGIKLGCQPQTNTTAAYIFHKFFKEADIKNYDVFLIGSTCLYLASKIKDDPLKVRDVINVSYNTLYRTSSPLELSDHYWAMRDAILQAELLIMRMIQFQLSFPDPYKYLLQYYRTLKGWLHPQDWKEVPLIQNAMSFLTDFHHCPAVVDYKAELLAIASLFLALQCYGISVPNTNDDDGVNWFTVFDPDLTRDKLWEITEHMMDSYDNETNEGM